LGDTVLAVHHSYKPGLRLPGGGVGWREDHHKAAVRELREEVGVTLDPAQLRLVASNPRGSYHLYEARVEAMPELVIDRREITEARFVRPTLLYEIGHRNRVGAYLRHARDCSDTVDRFGESATVRPPARRYTGSTVRLVKCPSSDDATAKWEVE
jgi:ADP-ribose pyrophosphatase YjhB (NUDIX family)